MKGLTQKKRNEHKNAHDKNWNLFCLIKCIKLCNCIFPCFPNLFRIVILITSISLASTSCKYLNTLLTLLPTISMKWQHFTNSHDVEEWRCWPAKDGWVCLFIWGLYLESYLGFSLLTALIIIQLHEFWQNRTPCLGQMCNTLQKRHHHIYYSPPIIICIVELPDYNIKSHGCLVIIILLILPRSLHMCRHALECHALYTGICHSGNILIFQPFWMARWYRIAVFRALTCFNIDASAC